MKYNLKCHDISHILVTNERKELKTCTYFARKNLKFRLIFYRDLYFHFSIFIIKTYHLLICLFFRKVKEGY